MNDRQRLVELAPGERDALDDALLAAGLPAVDSEAAHVHFFRLEDNAGPVGWAAIERYDRAALLRSVVILDDRRGGGAGSALVRGVIREAAAMHVGQLWLLTETAAPFFARLGFAPADRNAAPAGISETSEFKSLCPASATCMSLSLST